MEYQLERLGPFGFQDLAAALALRVFGAGVRPMGQGRDAGRDMLTTDPVRWSEEVTWTGTTVFQVKHKASLTSPRAGAGWLWTEIRHELERWASPDYGRGTVPDQLVFVSNVPLTAAPGGGFEGLTTNVKRWLAALNSGDAEDHLHGGEKDQARREREARRDRMDSLRRWEIIDRNHLGALLTAHRDVRLAFDAFLTAGDVLADLSRLSTTLSQGELAPALKQHARWALMSERDIYFDEAGAADTKGFPIDEVVIDLPIHVDGGASVERVIRYVLDRGDHVLRPSLASLEKPRHLVMAGAPGNGKTTVSRFLVHAYRAAWLGEDADLGDEHRKAVTATIKALTGMERSLPANRRWPIRVDLAKFAQEKATNSDYTLLTYLAETLSGQTPTKPVSKAVLYPWLRIWPSLLVLDGLDEVAEPAVRKGLVSDVKAFVADLETDDADVLVVVTTRPTGYNDELPPAVFERIDLADLTTDDAVRYGRLVTRIRVPNDEARRNGIVKLLEGAARDESLRRLLRTPLQVLIMSIIAESAKRFAPSRYELFWTYYSTVEQRERNKPMVGFSSLIRDHSVEVLDLHRRVGLLLQQRAETGTGTDSVLSPQDLRVTASQVLADAGYRPSGSDKDLLDRIVNAVTHRLVLLTPQRSGGYGFDVRSLQELMAAHALTTGDLESTLPKLVRIAASPHWRNTLLFAAGRYFADHQPHQKEAVTKMILAADEDAPDRLGTIVPVGPELALEVVDDGMATEPIYLDRLIDHALRLLQGPEPADLGGVARMLASAAAEGPNARDRVVTGLRNALGSTETARTTAERVQHAIGALASDADGNAELLGLAAVKRDPARQVPAEPVADWETYWAVLDEYATAETAGMLKEVGELCQGLARSPSSTAAENLQIYLADPDVALVTEQALSAVAAASPGLVVSLRDTVLPAVWRQPVMFS